MMVHLENVLKDYGGCSVAAVNGVSLDIREGEFLTILGPSGCGKTTTLRLIAGFEIPDEGKIIIDNEDVSKIPSYKRCVNTVFQNYALFPHLNVFENVAFGLNMKKVNAKEVEERVFKMLQMVKLEGYEKRMPSELSGGQCQRVAIARAVINNPKVLLLDEPLSALDYKLRKEMQLELKHLQKELNITFVFVTHDQEEALTMSDRIAVMNKGVIEQLGTPNEIYEKPATRFVASFIGETNLFKGKVITKDFDETMVDIALGNVAVKRCPFSCGEEVYLALRPERLKLSENEENVVSGIRVNVKERIYMGSILKTIVTAENGKEIIINESVGEAYDFAKFHEAYMTWNTDSVVVLK